MEEKTSPEVESKGLTIKECQDIIQKSLRTPRGKILKEHMKKAGCKVGDNFIRAIHCDKPYNGKFIHGEGIEVYCNNTRTQDEVTLTVIHELIHANDDCRAANFDLDNCAHRACTEIHANHLDGYCQHKKELLWSLMKITDIDQDCVRERAMMSVTDNASCPEAVAKEAMDAVWDTCYNDTKPFDRVP